MRTLEAVNFIISILFMACYAYQFLYIPVSWFIHGADEPESPKTNSYAVLICARNEEQVLEDLLTSLERQTYPNDRITVFVIADNCTDRTADIARAGEAAVYERWDSQRVGKGYALSYLMERISEDYPEGFDGYFVFDADNILFPDYIEQMDRTFSQGHNIVTGYRNSKNYGDNWISAGYALWFLRESRYLNYPRSLLGSSSMVSGTGFLFSRIVAEQMGEWPFHLLTEDIEFSAHEILAGEKIAFCPKAELLDEQPTTFSQSWRQRIRWTRGYIQVFWKYGGGLLRGIGRGSFSCFDMTMSILPAFILSALSLISNLILGIWGAWIGDSVWIAAVSLGRMVLGMYLTLFVIGGITTVTEWKHIRTSAEKKAAYIFTFPLFMFTYIPVSIAALFAKDEWKPIRHTVTAEQISLK